MKMHRWFLLGLAALALTGCFHDDDDDDDNRPAVRVLHGSPDAPPVDVRVDDRLIVENLAYTEASFYKRVPAGTPTVTVNATGSDEAVITATPSLNRNTAYTVIATGPLADLQPVVLEDDRSRPAAGNLRVRVVHAAPEAGPVDVYVTPPDTALADVTPVLSGVNFRDVSEALEIPSGNYRIRITAPGEKQAVYDSGALELRAGSILTAVALAATSGVSPVTLAMLTNDSDNPSFLVADVNASVRTVHASPDAPAVDVLVNGETVAENLGFTDATDYLPVPATSPEIVLNAAGTPNAILTAQPALERGRDYTVAAINFAASVEPLLITDDRSAPTEGQARIRFIHASPDAPAVDILVDGNPVATNVSFRDVSEFSELAAGDHEITVNLAGTDTAVLGPLTATLGNQGVYTVMAVGQAASLDALVLIDRAPVTP